MGRWECVGVVERIFGVGGDECIFLRVGGVGWRLV